MLALLMLALALLMLALLMLALLMLAHYVWPPPPNTIRATPPCQDTNVTNNWTFYYVFYIKL